MLSTKSMGKLLIERLATFSALTTNSLPASSTQVAANFISSRSSSLLLDYRGVFFQCGNLLSDVWKKSISNLMCHLCSSSNWSLKRNVSNHWICGYELKLEAEYFQPRSLWLCNLVVALYFNGKLLTLSLLILLGASDLFFCWLCC
jgi:hypothetical protein